MRGNYRCFLPKWLLLFFFFQSPVQTGLSSNTKWTLRSLKDFFAARKMNESTIATTFQWTHCFSPGDRTRIPIQKNKMFSLVGHSMNPVGMIISFGLVHQLLKNAVQFSALPACRIHFPLGFPVWCQRSGCSGHTEGGKYTFTLLKCEWIKTAC